MQALRPYNGHPLEISGNLYGNGGDVQWQLFERRPNGPALIAESRKVNDLVDLMADLKGSVPLS